MQSVIQFPSWSLLLKASWQAAVLIVLVLAAQYALGKRLGPRWRCGLWLLVILRLAIPWTVPSPISLFNVLDFSRASQSVVRRAETSRATPSANLPTSVSEVTARPDPPASGTTSRQAFSIGLAWLRWAWAAGAMGLALGLAASHYRLMRRVTPCRPLVDSGVLSLLEDCKQRMGVRVPVALVETSAVDGPCLFGFLRPRLLLPTGFTRDFSLDELRFVFLHELGHLKRHDIPLSWLTAGLQIVHWFNPLVWLAFSRMRRDRELACDAMALSHAEENDNKPYGRTIVKLLENFGGSLRAPSLAGIGEDKQQMKERILMIAQFHKSNRGLAWAAFLFTALGLLTLTDAQLGCKSTALETPGKDTSAHVQKQADPPRIIAISPAVAATEVDPALTEITVKFDQDMEDGYSWTGAGPEYPPTPERAKARWRDKRTCVLPVKLQAGHYYRVGLNSTSYQNFRSAAGMAALPSAVYFTTQGAREELKARLLVPQIVRFDPDNGAQTVSPEARELRVTFNLPMGGGCSWCTASDDGADFPRGREGKEMYWTDDRKTCVLPVELKPGMTYRLNLNAPEYKNFQSDGGVPLEPVLYTFKTSGPEKSVPQTDKG